MIDEGENDAFGDYYDEKPINSVRSNKKPV